MCPRKRCSVRSLRHWDSSNRDPPTSRQESSWKRSTGRGWWDGRPWASRSMRYDGSMKRFRAALVGASGYAGAEIIRRLLRHPDVELVRAVSVDHIGELVGDAHLSLEGATDLRFEKLPLREAAEGVDVVFLALPRGISAQEMPLLLETGARIIDMSGDFRLKSAASYERYYELAHPNPALLGSFVYGLPEQNPEAIRGASPVASPGCFATAIELGLLPLARAGLLAGEIETVGITGSSGSGVLPSQATH